MSEERGQAMSLWASCDHCHVWGELVMLGTERLCQKCVNTLNSEKAAAEPEVTVPPIDVPSTETAGKPEVKAEEEPSNDEERDEGEENLPMLSLDFDAQEVASQIAEDWTQKEIIDFVISVVGIYDHSTVRASGEPTLRTILCRRLKKK